MPRQTSTHPPPKAARELVGKLLESHLSEIQRILTSVAFHRGCRADEVEEILSDVAKQVIEKAEKFDPNRSFVPWVIGFLGNVLLQRKRQHKKASREVPASQLSKDANESFWKKLGFDESEKAETRRQLDELLAELSDDDRKAIELRTFNKCDFRELADAIGAASPGAARVRLSRALKRLRAIALREEGGAA